MKKSQLRWIESELPKLVEAEILSAEDADRMGAYFRSQKHSSLSSVALVVCSVLGACLIGSGIILLMAHNWENLTRPMRTFVAFAPLVVGQILVGWTLLRHPESTGWRESSGAFLTISIGVAIAIIGQTYHIPGNLASFLFVWLLLGLPVLYLLRSSMVSVLYLIGLCSWVISVQDRGGHALWYGPLLGGVLPFIWYSLQNGRALIRTRFLAWVLCLSFILSLGFVLERSLPGIWIVAYTSLFAVFYLVGRTWYRDTPGQPFSIIGIMGTVILALILTFDDAWREIGYQYYRYGYHYNEVAAYQDYLITLGLLGLCAAFSVRRIRQGDRDVIAWVCSPLMALIFFMVMNVSGPEDFSLIAVVAYNIYLLVLGCLTLASGVREGQLGLANSGVGILALLFIFRFFDSNLDFVSRGILFIFLGIVFLSVNLITARKSRSHSGEVS